MFPIACAPKATTSGSGIPANTYLQPGGLFTYKRPGGVFFYLRP